MSYKYNVCDIVNVYSIINSRAEITNRWKPEFEEENLYQLRILDGAYKSKLFWFAENEIIAIQEQNQCK